MAGFRARNWAWAAIAALALMSCGRETTANAGAPPQRAANERHDPNENAFFYRLTASYIYKPTGEPFVVDFVAGCNVEVRRYNYTGPTYRPHITPEIYYKAAPGGGAVGITTPVVCDKIYWEREGAIPKDFLPELVWFDDPKDLSFGWGYAGEDA
ncbi:MAG: hypothetical protein R3C60_02090 [Parvularculaceae bacterium]